MPESVRDRPTKAHEYIFLLTKSPRYFWDAEAVKEEAQFGASEWRDGGTAWAAAIRASPDDRRTSRPSSNKPGNGGSRNIRSVWTIATAPFAEAHFATFPPALAERCIKAGTSEKGACSACGAAWVRVVEREFVIQQDVSAAKAAKASNKGMDASNGWGDVPRGTIDARTTGWQPTCACNAPIAPCVVLDCFGGAGTVSLVAERLGRDSIYIDLSSDYAAMARKRIYDDAPMFAAVELG